VRRAVLAAALILAATAATAKETEPAPAAAPVKAASTVSGVTVTGEKSNPLVDKTTEFVRRRLPTSQNEQYARFHDPICVRVLGLPEGFDAFVTQRIVALARQVGASVDEAANCKTNVEVLFSTRPQAQLDNVAQKREFLLGFFYRAQYKATKTFSRPIQSWYLTRNVGTDGIGAFELVDPHPYDPDDGKMPAVKGRPGSRLGNDMSSELVNSLIIADAKKVAGEPIGAVADYVAVLALSRWRGLEKCSGMPTILNLMAEDCDAADRPEAATPEDVALLQGLYTVNPREGGSFQRAEIASAVRKAAAAEAREAAK
jgi:hypothetical protein